MIKINKAKEKSEKRRLKIIKKTYKSMHKNINKIIKKRIKKGQLYANYQSKKYQISNLRPEDTKILMNKLKEELVNKGYSANFDERYGIIFGYIHWGN
jgi:hypothetical protein